MKISLPSVVLTNLIASASSVAWSDVPVSLKLRADTVHWGYFSKNETPVLTVDSGQEIMVEMATHHACDDWDKMIKGDEGMESIYHWNETLQAEAMRGATGGGDGVHILTGPIYVEGAEPGDLLKVEIMDLVPRPNPAGKTYGSNAAAWWGYQARVKTASGMDFMAGKQTGTPGENDEVVTIYEIVSGGDGADFVTPVYQYEWPTITDPMGMERDFIQYPGTCTPHDMHGDTTISKDVEDMGWTKVEPIVYYDEVFPAKIPINYHVGCMGLAPESHDFVDSIPPMPTGGNLDNKRIGIGTTMYYPVEVAGALLSMGDAHAAQADSELDGTGIETSITGKFRVTVIKQVNFTGGQSVVDFPLGETESDWIVHGFTETDYLETFFNDPSLIYGADTPVDKAMKNAFTQTRKFIMAEYDLTEMEATTIITQGVDFAVTQVVDGNFGVHGVVPKILFSQMNVSPVTSTSRNLADEADLKLSADTVHWGYFSKNETPVLTIESGETVVVEMATHHACDDYDKMILGDVGLEQIFGWNETSRIENYRGASGAGDGVHILTGPIYVNGSEPGDILKVEILDLVPRPNAEGETYGSNAAAWWGFQYRVPATDGSDLTAGEFTGTPGENDEFVTIYQLMTEAGTGKGYAVPAYQFEWPTLVDPMGATRDYIAYPGTCVPHVPHGNTMNISEAVASMGWVATGNITYYDDVFPAKIPINYHVGCMGLAPESHDFVDSIPPMPTGGNLDNKRIGVGTTMYYPVEVAGALLSMGDAHAAQGDSELDGTGIETSITGKFKITVIKKADFTPAQMIQNFPLGETDTEWIVHGFTETDYLETFSSNPGDIYSASSTDKALMNTFSQTRDFVMAQYNITEREAWTIITQAVNFGFTQLVDGNWGMHGLVPKAVFEGEASPAPTPPPTPSVNQPTTAPTGDDLSGAAIASFTCSLVIAVIACL